MLPAPIPRMAQQWVPRAAARGHGWAMATNMNGRLAGRVALITGTAGGQGAAAAELFAAEGAVVVGCDVKEAPGVARVDLTDETAVRDWIDEAAAEHGGVDILY